MCLIFNTVPYLVNIQTERHEGDTETTLLRSLTGLWTHVQGLYCQLQAKKKKTLKVRLDSLLVKCGG